jgi:transcription antitermination factor NusG
MVATQIYVPFGNTSLIEDGEALSSAAGRPRPAGPPTQPDDQSMHAVGDASRWFAVYTTPRHEKAVGRQFDARQIASFLPLYRTARRWKNGCKVTVEQPLFPSYIFVHIARRHAVKVLQVPGVISIVSAGREPAPLPTSDIESLRSGLPQRNVEPHPYLLVGEKVRIVAGSLEGMVGVLLRKKNNLRVVLTLDLIRQSIAVEVGIDEIEPLKS